MNTVIEIINALTYISVGFSLARLFVRSWNHRDRIAELENRVDRLEQFDRLKNNG